MQDQEEVTDRYQLSIGRISEMLREETVCEPFRFFFLRGAEFLLMIDELYIVVEQGDLANASLETLQIWNQRLYEDILGDAYLMSYTNPTYAASKLGMEFGTLFAFLFSELRLAIGFAYEGKRLEITILNELFIEIYNRFENERPTKEEIQKVIYDFIYDYSDLMVSSRTKDVLDSASSFASGIVMNWDLSDLRYLYQYGEYISSSELKIASYLNGLSEEKIGLMAHTLTEGYERGFKNTGRDLSKKSSVYISYEIGFERVLRYVIETFNKMGLSVILVRAFSWSINKTPNRKRGFFATSPNKQYEYDHRYDCGLYLDEDMKERKLKVLKEAYETYQQEASHYAGPILIETFGQEDFLPENKKENCQLSKEQESLMRQMATQTSSLINQYIPGSETSFTIIAFPVPEIGPEFEQIFDETIRINTLDYELYNKIQLLLIDALDQAEYVEIRGKEGNQTNLRVAMGSLVNKEKETNFENCLADVNIPLGEVFTSPKLKGTQGILNIHMVYIGGIQFKNLKMEFKDGMVTSYSCDNFEDAKEGELLIKQLIMKNHDSLPLGEFAIGTNTTAYAMAKRYDILHKLPILIVEKMGPHFAVGDTCYSWAEEVPTYNCDGKKVVAKDNEISIKRKEEVSNAYFSCHTDLTLPYDELHSITVVTSLGEKIQIIEGGRFVLPGSEELNKPFKS